MMTAPAASPDRFVGRVIGRLTVIARQKRGGRTAYVCLCTCGNTTAPMRAPYIVRRGELAACYHCSHGLPRSGAPVRSAAPLLRGEREQPTNAEPEDDRYEQSGNPIWRERARLLALAITRPMPTAAVIVLSRAHFGWRDEETREVLAAADGLELVKFSGMWQRNEARSPAPSVSNGSR